MNTLILMLLSVLSQDPADPKLGTAIDWEESVDAAARKALKEEKLVLVLHVAGHFDRPGLT